MKVVTVLGPPHSGKTTLVGAMAHLDGGAGASITLADAATVTTFRFLGEDWAAIDIAGGPDSLPHAGPALATSDAAVVVVPPDGEAAVLSAPYLRLAEEAGLPVYIFMNKMDASTERVHAIVAALQSFCRHNIILRQIPIRDGGHVVGAVDLISERAWKYREGEHSALIELPPEMLGREQEARAELLESLADFDDHLLEELIEDQKPMTDEIYGVAARTLAHADLVPCFLGAASHANGVTRLMKSLRHEVPTIEALGDRLGAGPDAIAVGSLAEVRKHLGKLVLLRALRPGAASGSPLSGSNLGGLTDLDAKTPVARLEPGQLALSVKSDHLEPRRLYSSSGSTPLPAWAEPRPAMFREVVSPRHDRDDARLSAALTRLAEIDPGLQIEQDVQSGRSIMAAQGPLHARRLTERLASDFGVEIDQSQVPPAFRETISKKVEWHHRHRKQSGGAGQFADVVIDLAPNPRGEGEAFTEEVKGGAVPRNYIPAVEAGAMEALREGPNGFPVVDVHVVLKDGKSHSVDSSDYAFRTAGKNAVKEAMAEAGAVALQPIARVEIHVPSVFSGALVPAMNGLKGQVLGFSAHPDAKGWDVFQALLPATTQDELYRTLAGATRGTAWFSSQFDHYEEISVAELRKAAAEGKVSADNHA